MTSRPALVVTALLALVLAVAGPAAAHKTATSPDGNLKIIWGFLNEPAVTMTKNGLDLRIQDNATGYNIPDLQSSIHVEMHHGDDEMEFHDLTGQFGKPGYYTGVITPSKPGLYILHVSGTVNGTELDMEIPAAHDIEDIHETYFPPVDDATDTSAAVAKLQADVKALQDQVAALDAKLKIQATTPTDTTPQTSPTGNPVPGFDVVLVALGAVGLALVLRRRA